MRDAVFALGLRDECLSDELVHEAVSSMFGTVAEFDVLVSVVADAQSQQSQIFVADITEIAYLVVVEVLYGPPYLLFNEFHSINIFY